ncbi:hypothetical protein CLV40_107161 [Actinokineospora auranticolor]|uniref:Uncharacterized protein n=2 Tax=Actinokineospora auranticolor TaxID=155976 RepID=A0A2S6GQN6_9PSEU|nr:hypothetical protein CLV40_107161 [Actinokineospora auranticolor]
MLAWLWLEGLMALSFTLGLLASLIEPEVGAAVVCAVVATITGSAMIRTARRRARHLREDPRPLLVQARLSTLAARYGTPPAPPYNALPPFVPPPYGPPPYGSPLYGPHPFTVPAQAPPPVPAEPAGPPESSLAHQPLRELADSESALAELLDLLVADGIDVAEVRSTAKSAAASVRALADRLVVLERAQSAADGLSTSVRTLHEKITGQIAAYRQLLVTVGDAVTASAVGGPDLSDETDRMAALASALRDLSKG